MTWLSQANPRQLLFAKQLTPLLLTNGLNASPTVAGGFLLTDCAEDWLV